MKTPKRMVARTLAAVAVVVGFGWERLTIVLACLGSASWLAVEGKIDPSAVVGLITLIVGYVFGKSAPEGKKG